MVKTISITEFRGCYLKVLEDVELHGNEYIVLKYGKEFIRVVPATPSTFSPE